MKKYKSKVGLGIVLFIVIVLGITSTIMIIHKVWIGLAINLIVLGFMFYLFSSTYYIIEGNNLKIKSGFLYKQTIKIDLIKKIVKTNNPISSPATSLDRIAITYNKTDTVIVSPKDKMDFIDHLKNINPEIEVNLKINKK